MRLEGSGDKERSQQGQLRRSKSRKQRERAVAVVPEGEVVGRKGQTAER